MNFKVWQIFFDNLTMSLYSYQFYQRVYKDFAGYGVKHLLTCCVLASIINCTWLFSQCNNLLGYLQSNKPVAYSAYLDAIFNELPKISYDGKKISSEEISKDSAFFIKNPKLYGKPNLVAINLSDKHNTTNLSLINLTKTKLILNAKTSDIIEIPYTVISNTPTTIDGKKLKKITTSYVQDIRHLFLYKSFPGIFIFNLYNTLVQNIFLLICNAIIVRVIFQKDISKAIRPVMFAISGLIVIKSVLQPFMHSTSFIDYYSTITMLLASVAIITSERKISYLR